ncbi:hypothetical protein E1B28_005344 [Marasmius oreades]|uniref:Uncharacterized protein n=1 Tax=Marasmius oreades TaxID=181124 RepID=A0A9P7S393_9AGAR|nr:uncharacterized protein E1B28_005344 [Marasmius oreades]KAG7094512.1 hypothetical protein E1B28_005344 [Marasmius oreades]
MRSFTFFATLAAAALSLAAPLTNGYPDDSAVAVRGGDRTVPDVLVDLVAKVKVDLDPFHYITKDNCTYDNVAPVVVKVKVDIQLAIDECTSIIHNHGVYGQDGNIPTGVLAVILSVGAKVWVSIDIAGILAKLLLVICGALHLVIKVVAEVDKKVIFGLLVEVLVLVCALLKIVLGLLAGILACLLPLIIDIKVVVDLLGCHDIFAAIGIYLL